MKYGSIVSKEYWFVLMNDLCKSCSYCFNIYESKSDNNKYLSKLIKIDEPIEGEVFEVNKQHYFWVHGVEEVQSVPIHHKEFVKESKKYWKITCSPLKIKIYSPKYF
jgi:hypothetical protein